MPVVARPFTCLSLVLDPPRPPAFFTCLRPSSQFHRCSETGGAGTELVFRHQRRCIGAGPERCLDGVNRVQPRHRFLVAVTPECSDLEEEEEGGNI